MSNRTVTLRNASRIPVRYRWALPSRLRKVIAPSPTKGFIRGNENVDINFSFSPRIEKLYRFKLNCFFYSNEDDPLATRNCDLPLPDGMRKRLVRQDRLLSISILGEGTSGAISFSPSTMDFKTLLLGTKETMPLKIQNNSDCNLKFNLEVVKMSDVAAIDTDQDGVVEADELDKYQAQNDGKQTSEIVFADPKGVLPARASRSTLLTFCPTFPGKQEFRVFWELDADNAYGGTTKNADLKIMKGDPLFCNVVGEAGYPTLEFTDVRSNDGLGPSWLWQQFNLNSLNTILARPLTRKDIKYNNTEGLNQDPSGLDTFDFHFTPRPVNSEPMIATFEIKNAGALPVEFFFKLPNDSDVEIENWADVGEPGAEQTRVTGILSHGLFKISPRRGRLTENESSAIRIEYNYITTDPVLGEEHVLPAILQLKKGKQVRIMLRGRTLESDQPCLRVVRDVFEQEMAIGQPVAPEYPLRIFNPSAVSLAYELNMHALTSLKKENYGCDVIKCENPKGVVEAGQISALKWKFQPLEAKTYKINTTVSYFPPGRYTRPLQLAKMKVPLQISCHGTHNKGDKKVKSKIKKPVYSLPSAQKVLIPGQTAKLSHDQINFGDIPQDAKTHRLVVLRGLGDNTTQYQWDDQHPLILSKTIKIYPMSGTVSAGSHVVTRICLKANTTPSTVASEVGCVLTPVSNNGQPLADERIFSGIFTQAYLTTGGLSGAATSVAGKTHHTSYTSKSFGSSVKQQKPVRESVITARTASHVNREAANAQTSVERGLPVTQELARRDNRASRPPQSDEEDDTAVEEVGPRQVVLHVRVTFNIRGREALENKADFYRSAIEVSKEEAMDEDLQMNKDMLAHKDVLLSLTDNMIRDAVRDPSIMDTMDELRSAGSAQVVPFYEQLVADAGRGRTEDASVKGLEEPTRADVCHRVLEETFYNLIQEVLQGELRLDRPPRVVLN